MLLFAGLVLVLFGALAQPGVRASTTDGVVEILAFSKSDCGDCEHFNEVQLPAIKKKYGDRIKVRYMDTSDAKNLQSMVLLESQYGEKPLELPQVYIDGVALVGEEEVRSRLDETIDAFIVKGGSDMPEIPKADNREPGAASKKPIYLTYFYSKGCRECDPVSLQLEYLKKFDSQVVLREYDLMTRRGMETNEAMCLASAVPEVERGIAPSLFVGLDYYVGDELTTKGIKEAVENKRDTGTEYPWKSIEDDTSKSKQSLNSRMNTFTIFAVMGAGLVDGVNPCAFTVLIFLFSYLAFVGRRGKDILYIGGAYTLAVLITYFLIGLGLLSFLRVIGAAGKWVSLGIAIITLIFGLVTLYDYIQSRRKPGKASSTLGLPRSITRRIHGVIRDKARTRNLIVAGVVMGVLIAALELGCTGQVYLPTISFVARAGGDRLEAVLYLIAYDLMFIVPLVIVFIIAYTGTHSEKLVEFARKHTPTLELLSSLVFFGLAALLFATL